MTPRPTSWPAAQRGLRAQFTWVDGATAPADDLIRRELLPLAWQGLRAAGLDSADVDRYLGGHRAAGGVTPERGLLAAALACGHAGLGHAGRAAERPHGGGPSRGNGRERRCTNGRWPKVEEGRGGKPQALRIEEVHDHGPHHGPP